jgi:Rrf2 family protein
MLSKSCVYAIRSLVFIAQNATVDSKMGIKAVAEELDLPTPYLGKILQQLTRNKIIQGVKGPRGGFYLTNECKKTKIIKVIEVMDGLDFFTTCGLGLKDCSDAYPCPMHNEFKVYKEGLWDLYNSRSIADLVTSVDDGDSYIINP